MSLINRVTTLGFKMEKHNFRFLQCSSSFSLATLFRAIKLYYSVYNAYLSYFFCISSTLRCSRTIFVFHPSSPNCCVNRRKPCLSIVLVIIRSVSVVINEKTYALTIWVRIFVFPAFHIKFFLKNQLFFRCT